MSEHDEQVILFQFIDLYKDRFPELDLVFAVPNAGKRSIGAGKYYLEEGLRSGVPDVIVPISVDPWTGLAIEMKFGDNKQTESQILWQEKLVRHDWKYLVLDNGFFAFKMICQYLKLPIEIDYP